MSNLAAAGHEIHLVTSPADDFRDIHEGDWIVHRIPLPNGISPIRDIAAIWALLVHFRRQKYDLINAHMFKAGFLAMIAGALSRQPRRMYHNHGMLFLSKRGFSRWLLRLAERLTCALAHRVYYVSFSNQESAIAEGITTPIKSRVIGSGSIRGVEAATFQSTPERLKRGRQIRSQIKIPESAFVVGFVGRAVEHKGYYVAVDCWMRHFVDKTDSFLLLIGSTPDVLVQAAGHHPRNVKVVPWTDQIADYYAAMDLLILPSFHEGLPYTLIEANAAGLPVIASRISGNLDAVEHAVNGLLVAPGDIDDLAQAVCSVRQDPDLRNSLGQAGYERIRHKYDPADVERAFLLEFESVLDGPGNRPPSDGV